MARETNALVLTGVREMALRREPETPVPSDAFVRVRVHSCGICGSDMHAYHGHDERRVPPLVLGHEIVGWLEDTGERVAVNPLMTCGQCFDCQRAREHLCERREMLGMRVPGGFAPTVVVKSRNVSLLGDDLSFEEAVIIEPLACAFHAVHLGMRHNGGHIHESIVTIIGGGAIGLLIAQVLMHFDVQGFNIVEANPRRRKILAECLPEANVLAPDEAEDDQDFVFDAVGSGKTRALAMKIIAPGGTLSHVGLQDNEEGIDARQMTLQEVAMVGSYCYDLEAFDYSLELLKNRKIRFGKWMDYRPLSAGKEAFEELAGGSDYMKIVLKLGDRE